MGAMLGSQFVGACHSSHGWELTEEAPQCPPGPKSPTLCFGDAFGREGNISSGLRAMLFTAGTTQPVSPDVLSAVRS
ncbi:hypothetical protein BP5796_09578 [Coleophoma crateriformis]|uniref:Uncharacterized protein n=1 Tax=Coleophoma crateriformis TaxID=565419 RepID=A0A3D8QYG6_9HELO|nr:hypothetical protein BP5796_09578 [Coleophoma crateriformis]